MIFAYGDATIVAEACEKALTKPSDFARLKQDVLVVMADRGGTGGNTGG
jgi:hypothetical protein